MERSNIDSSIVMRTIIVGNHDPQWGNNKLDLNGCKTRLFTFTFFFVRSVKKVNKTPSPDVFSIARDTYKSSRGAPCEMQITVAQKLVDSLLNIKYRGSVVYNRASNAEIMLSSFFHEREAACKSFCFLRYFPRSHKFLWNPRPALSRCVFLYT